MSKDNLVICKRCGSNACYEDAVTEEIKTYWCYGCGFMSNSLMVDGNEFLERQTQVLPELYKDLVYEDDEGKKWIPSSVNKPKMGMVFIDGNKKDNWRWAGVKAVKIEEEEREKYPIPGKDGDFYEHRMDMETIKHFEERDYMDALSYIGVLPDEKE